MKALPTDYETLEFDEIAKSWALGLQRAPACNSEEFAKRVANLAENRFENQIQRLMRDSGISREAAEDARLDFLRFMSLLYVKPGAPIVPSRKADSFWHVCLLYTEEYFAFCRRHFGRFIHHRPGADDKTPMLVSRSHYLISKLYGIDWAAEAVAENECASCDHGNIPPNNCKCAEYCGGPNIA